MPLLPVIFFGIFFSVIAVLYISGRKTLETVKFNGKIEKIIYDEKNIPTVTVNGILYNLTPLRKEFKDRVRVGDIIKKESGKSTYVIIQQGTNEEIKFNF